GETDGVESTVSFGMAPVLIDDKAALDYGPQYQMTNFIDGNPESIVSFVVVEGSMDLDDHPGFIANRTLAESNGWKVCETYELSSPLNTLETADVELVAIYEPN